MIYFKVILITFISLTLSNCLSLYDLINYRSELTLDKEIHSHFITQDNSETEQNFQSKRDQSISPDKRRTPGPQVYRWSYGDKKLFLTVDEAYKFVIANSIRCQCEIRLALDNTKCFIVAYPREKKILIQKVKYIKVKSNCFQTVYYQY